MPTNSISISSSMNETTSKTGSADQGRLFVIAAPSGAGKTTLVHRLMDTNPNLRFSVSYTTRPKRRGEVNGRDYHFVEADAFQRMAADGEFLEHAEVFDHRYATSRSQVDRRQQSGCTGDNGAIHCRTTSAGIVDDGARFLHRSPLVGRQGCRSKPLN